MDMLYRQIAPFFSGGAFLLLLVLLFLLNKWKPEKEKDTKRRKIKKFIKSLLLFIIIWIVGGVAMITNPIIGGLNRTINFFLLYKRKSGFYTPIDYFSVPAFLIGLLVAIKDFTKKSWLWFFLTLLIISFLLFVFGLFR